MENSATLDAEIIALAQDNWKRRSSPMLFSALGERLSEEAKTTLRIQGRTLKRYVRESMQSLVRFVNLPRHGGGVAPIADSKALSDENLEAMLLKAGSEAKAVRRYSAGVWNAFRDGAQFDDDTYLLVSAERGAEVRRTIDRTKAPSDAAFIEREDLPELDPETNRASFASISAAIEKWTTKNGVDIELLTYRPPASADPSHDSATGSRTGSVAVSLEGGLWDMLTLLSEEELRRINVPADIVFSIFKRLRSPR